MDIEPRSIFAGRSPWRKRRRPIFVALGLLAALAFNISIAVTLANDQPNDGKLYSQIAKNILEQGVFSAEAEAPFTPTLIRLPGYPGFLAAVYYVAGVGNDTAVREVQAVSYVLASVLAAMLAWNWCSGPRRRRRKAAYWTFFLAAFCPFTAIFSATILTETLTIFFLAGLMLTATYAFKTKGRLASVLWWVVTGLAAGMAVLLRPDSGLFALGIGLTIVVSGFIFRPAETGRVKQLLGAIWKGFVFSAVFIVVLVPWTIRNESVFGVFQPLAPAHAEMPGEFVPRGYLLWVRTWIDDSRYIGPMLWDLEDKPIKIEQVPAYAFASDEEKTRVAALLDQYNHSDPDQAASDETKDDDSSAADYKSDSSDSAEDPQVDEPDQVDADEELDLKISPEVDAGFQQIAEERIAREPWRFYVGLPAKRAVSMWFDTHSAYFPFGGELFPVKDLDNEQYQNLWLPLFAALMWIYTLLAFIGAIFLCRGRGRLWLAMAILVSLPRIVFFGTLENPEPRYLVELFLIAAVLGGIVLSRFKSRRRAGAASVEFLYRNIG
ncbi:MAG: phospholipid carrier-dependent glycosyltransferase [Pyrinomonadaceae bacterium]